jgi:hypothetical protein
LAAIPFLSPLIGGERKLVEFRTHRAERPPDKSPAAVLKLPGADSSAISR